MAARRQILFVTGRLAEEPLRRLVEQLGEHQGFAAQVQVLPITVAALMTPAWIAKHLVVPPQTDEIWLPGYCGGNLEPLEEQTDVPLHVGPKDLHELPVHFGQPLADRAGYGAFDIEILAEINHAPALSRRELLEQARHLAQLGADVIDVGCIPGRPWREVGAAVRALRDDGLRVSIDSMDIKEIEWAAQAGAELVLSVCGANCAAAADWGIEVVAIPDQPEDLASLYRTVELLASRKVRFRIDPILEPIGCGFAASLGRYLEVRRRYPEAEMMMGIGNLTELTDADSAPINVLLMGFCQELAIRSVLTTQVIPWARTSVRECDLGRRLVHYAAVRGTVPKHVEPRLVLLRDAKVNEAGLDELQQLAQRLRDPNYRIFVSGGQIHLMAAGLYFQGTDPYRLLQQLQASKPRNLDVAHAFYLGYELAKARTALTLGKQYVQDEALQWGFLTEDEPKK